MERHWAALRAILSPAPSVSCVELVLSIMVPVGPGALGWAVVVPPARRAVSHLQQGVGMLVPPPRTDRGAGLTSGSGSSGPGSSSTARRVGSAGHKLKPPQHGAPLGTLPTVRVETAVGPRKLASCSGCRHRGWGAAQVLRAPSRGRRAKLSWRSASVCNRCVLFFLASGDGESLVRFVRG